MRAHIIALLVWLCVGTAASIAVGLLLERFARTPAHRRLAVGIASALFLATVFTVYGTAASYYDYRAYCESWWGYFASFCY